MTNAIANDPVQAVPSAQKKRHGKWIAVGAAMLTVAGIVLYKYGGKGEEKVSPLEPEQARYQVPVDKAVERKPAQHTAPASVPSVDVAPSVPDKSESSAMLSRLSSIEQVLGQQGKAIEKLSSDIAELVSAEKRPEKNPAPAESEQPRPRKRRYKTAAQKKVKEAAESKTDLTQPRETAPELLSVDSWNGRPSVAVRNGATVQFIGEGDRAGAYTLQRAEQGSQRATFADPAGAVVVKEHTER